MARDLERSIRSLLRPGRETGLGPARPRAPIPAAVGVADWTLVMAPPAVVPSGWLCLPTSPSALYGYDADWLPLPSSPSRCDESPVRLVEGESVSIYPSRSRGWPSFRVPDDGPRVSWGLRLARTVVDTYCVTGYNEDVWVDNTLLHPATPPSIVDWKYFVEDAKRITIGGNAFWRWITRYDYTWREPAIKVYTLAVGAPASEATIVSVTGLSVPGLTAGVYARQCVLSEDGKMAAVLGATDTDWQDTHVFLADLEDLVAGSVAATLEESWEVGGVSFQEELIDTGTLWLKRTVASGWVTRPFRVEFEAGEVVVTRARVSGAYDYTQVQTMIGTMSVPDTYGNPVLWVQYPPLGDEGCPFWLGWSDGRMDVSEVTETSMEVERAGASISPAIPLYSNNYAWTHGGSNPGGSMVGAPTYYFFAYDIVDDEVVCKTPADYDQSTGEWVRNPCRAMEFPQCESTPGEGEEFVLTGVETMTPVYVQPSGCVGEILALLETGALTETRYEFGPQKVGTTTLERDFSATAVLHHEDGVAEVECGVGNLLVLKAFAPTSSEGMTTQLKDISKVLLWDSSSQAGARVLVLPDDGEVVWTARTSWSGTTLPSGQVTTPGGFLWTSSGGVATWLPVGASSAGHLVGGLGVA